jgi:hypothetical protein
MAYMRFDIEAELRKVSKGRKPKVDPAVLLYLIADDYLNRAGCLDDSTAFLERLYNLPDPRV